MSDHSSAVVPSVAPSDVRGLPSRVTVPVTLGSVTVLSAVGSVTVSVVS